MGMFDVVAEVTNNVRASALRRDSSRREQIAFVRVALLERSLACGSSKQSAVNGRFVCFVSVPAYFKFDVGLLYILYASGDFGFRRIRQGFEPGLSEVVELRVG